MSAINWFELPATDFERAVAFYETAFGVTMRREEIAGGPNAIFPYEQGKGPGGAIINTKYSQPSKDGAIVYLNAQSAANLDQVLSRIETAGGKVVMPKTDIGPVGFIAMILDTEGNRVGLHAEHPEA